MYPIDFLRLAVNSEVIIALKSSEVLKGILYTVDSFMNLKLKSASLTSKDGTTRTMTEVYIRGVEVKNVQLPDKVLDEAAVVEQVRQRNYGTTCLRRGNVGGNNFRRNNTTVSGYKHQQPRFPGINNNQSSAGDDHWF